MTTHRSDEGPRLVEGPSVVLNRLGEIRTYEVMESDLNALDAYVSEENQALAFTTFCGGIAVPTIVSALTTEKLSERATAIYASVSIITIIATIWFLICWLRVRKKRPDLLTKIKGEQQS